MTTDWAVLSFFAYLNVIIFLGLNYNMVSINGVLLQNPNFLRSLIKYLKITNDQFNIRIQ